jgi:hypothetical protein
MHEFLPFQPESHEFGGERRRFQSQHGGCSVRAINFAPRHRRTRLRAAPASKGIEKHIEDLSAMFVYAPDTRIKVHTVKLGQGEWTAVIGVMEGTFSKPMPIGNGKSIKPTGKAFKITMATFGHWVNGVMNEEYLFWDNQEFMKEIGLGK